MDIKNVLSYLKESVRDIPARPDNIHYTNFESLYYILQTGLKGQNYDTKSDKARPGDEELATVRNSHKMTAAERHALSANSDRGGVRINLYTNRILASLRNARKATIAELPKQREEFLKDEEEKFKKEFGFDIPKIFDSNES